jgi:ribosome biogenesis GTPase
MELCELGLDRWFADKAREQCGSGLSVVRVTAVDRGRYLIRDEHGVLARKSFLRRKAPGNDIDFQMIAANIDVAFVIQSCHFGRFGHSAMKHKAKRGGG